jgi:chromosome segregation ATPase
METTITKQAPRAADRLNETVAALTRLLDQAVNDIQALDSEYQLQLIESVQQTEASLEKREAERLNLAVEKAQEDMRALVTGELQAQFSRDTAATLEKAQKEWNAERDRLTQELDRLQQAVAEAQTEQGRLRTECERVNQLMEKTKTESADADEAAAIALERQVATATSRMRAELTARWEKERAILVAERNRAQQRLADAATEYEQQLAGELDGLRQQLKQSSKEAAPAPSPAPAASPDLELIRAEAGRIEASIAEISKLVEDPDTELSVVIRKNVERAELESYLRGLRFKVPDA